MVRPRFARLPVAQQDAILGAALDEFAAHGFHDASLNRVIDAAGISKGSMYYYFDGKEDLFVHVARVEFERLFAAVGPVDVARDGPDAFWSAVERFAVDVATSLVGRPRLAALARRWLAASDDAGLRRAQEELERETLPWIDRVLAAGQAAGAVRTDLPPGLLSAVAVGMGRAMDAWFLAQRPDEGPDPDEEVPPLIGTLVGLLRRALQP